MDDSNFIPLLKDVVSGTIDYAKEIKINISKYEMLENELKEFSRKSYVDLCLKYSGENKKQ